MAKITLSNDTLTITLSARGQTLVDARILRAPADPRYRRPSRHRKRLALRVEQDHRNQRAGYQDCRDLFLAATAWCSAISEPGKNCVEITTSHERYAKLIVELDPDEDRDAIVAQINAAAVK